MSEPTDRSMEELIERSSLGTEEARRRRMRVSPDTGRLLARAASAQPRPAEKDERKSQG
jgi:hypothetical protein